ncbi:MAG: DsbA family oxidoreductase [Bacteroidota bacterium]
MMTVTIEFISDFICPWCYIGKTRLEKVAAILEPEINLRVLSRPYELYPALPTGGLPRTDFSKKAKPGMGKSLKKEAEKEGIKLNYRLIERIPNSLEAHRLVWLAKQESLQYELTKRIFHGYFEEGNDIEKLEYLAELAKEVGLSDDIIRPFCDSRTGQEELRTYLLSLKEEEFVSVVPSLKFGGKFLLPGLQEESVWISYIRRAARLQEK